MGKTKPNVVREKRRSTIEHEAVPIIAAETVVTRHLKIVDDEGNVRADVAVDVAGEQGPRLRLFDRDGRALVVLSLVDGAECHGITSLYMVDQHDDSDLVLSVGSLRGPGIHFRHETGITVHVGAESRTGLIESRRVGAETVMQLVPGEEPTTFVDLADDGERDEVAS